MNKQAERDRHTKGSNQTGKRGTDEEKGRTERRLQKRERDGDGNEAVEPYLPAGLQGSARQGSQPFWNWNFYFL